MGSLRRAFSIGQAMTNEVASIGIAVQTSDLEKGIKSLEALAQQGPKVEKALDGVEKTVSKTSKSLKTLGEGAGKGLDEVGRSAPRAAEGVGRVAKSADDAKVALAGIKQSAAGLASVSSSATQAARGLSGFAGGAKSAHAAMAEMQAAIRNASQGVSAMAAEMAKLPATLQATAKAQEQAAKSAVDMAQALKQTTDQARAYASASSNIADASQKTAKSMDATASAARAMASVLAVAGVGFGANELIAMVDGYTKYTAQLKLATKSTTDQAVAMASVKRIATDAQQGLGEIGTLYARITNGTAELGLSQSKLANITETVALSLKVSGAAASESSSAMLQLSQAFASGVLRGEEFNSVSEAAPRLMKALADGMNVPIGALRKMAEEGKLTSAVLAEALPKALGQLREEAKSVQTISGAFQVLKNNIMEMVGAQSNASGTTKAFANGINGMANNLDIVAAAAAAVATVLGARVVASVTASGVAFAASTVQAVRYQAALAGMAGVSGSAATGLIAMGAAARGASAAMAFVGGPIGAIVTAAGLAATAFYAFGSSAGNLAKEIGGLNQPLDDLKRKIDALPSEKRVAVILDIKEEAAKKAKEAEASFDDLAAAMVGAFSGARAASADSAKQVNNLVDKLDAAKKTGADMTPILRDAAKAAGVSNSTLKSWLDLAANIRSARDAAKAGDQVSDVIGAGGGRGTVNPSTVGQIAESARTQAKTALEATKAYQSQAEQMAKVRTEGDSLRTALKALEQSNQGTGASADQLRERIKGVDERLASLAKRGQSGASAVKAEQTAYASLVASLDAKIAANAEELKYGKQLSESDKLRIKLTAEIESGSRKITEAHKAEAMAKLKILNLQEQEQEYRDNFLRSIEAERKLRIDAAAAAEKTAESLESGNKSLREEIELIGLSADQQLAVNRARLEAQILVKEQHLAEMQRANDAVGFMSREQIALEEQIRLLKERLGLLDDKKVRDANAKAQERLEKEWDKTAQTIGDTLADYIMGGGKNAAQYLERLFATLVLQPVVNYGVQGVMGALGMGQTGAAAGSVLGGNNVGTTILNNAGLIGAGFQAMYGMSVGASSASLAAANAVGMVGGDALGTLIAGNGAWAGVAVEAGATAGAAAGAAQAGSFMSGVAAAAPWVAGAAALYSIAKSFDDSGTPHTGAGAIYKDGAVSGGKSIFNGANFDFGAKWSEKAQSSVTAIAGGLGSSLDSVATAFGKKAGYSIYTAFADDSSGDGAWGSLKIADAVGNVLVNWQDTRRSRWAPKEFADGEEGYKQYLTAIASDVKSAFMAMDLPAWADNLLAAATDLDTLNAALSQIAVNKAGFDALAASMSMFKGISEELQTQLLATAGSMDALTSVAGSYYGSSMYTEGERMLSARQQQMDALASMGLYIDPAEGEKAKALFKQTVEEAMRSGQGELAVKLMAMSASFAQVADYATKLFDDVAAKAAEAAKTVESQMTSAFNAMTSAGDLLDKIDGALGGSGSGYSLLREQRLWASMAEADYKQQIELAGQLTDMVLGRYQLEQQNAQKLLDFGKSLRSYVESLKIGNLSPFTTAEKLAEAAKQYADTLTKAQGGDASAMGALQGISSSYLDLARQYFASSGDYTKIFNSVTGSLDALGLSSQTEAQMQLDVSSQSLSQLRQLQGIVQGAYQKADADFGVQKDLLQQQINQMLRTANGIEAVRDLLAGMPAELSTQLNGGGAAGHGGGGIGSGSFATLAQSYVDLLGGKGSTDVGYVAAAMSNLDYANWQSELNSAMALLTDAASLQQMQSIFDRLATLNGLGINGSHANGLEYVPFDGYIAQLHKGERVMTAAENRVYTPAWSNYGMGDGMAAMAAEIKSLNARIDRLTEQNERLMTAQIRATVESNQDNAERVVRGVGQATERAAYAKTIQPEGYK